MIGLDGKTVKLSFKVAVTDRKVIKFHLQLMILSYLYNSSKYIKKQSWQK